MSGVLGAATRDAPVPEDEQTGHVANEREIQLTRLHEEQDDIVHERGNSDAWCQTDTLVKVVR